MCTRRDQLVEALDELPTGLSGRIEPIPLVDLFGDVGGNALEHAPGAAVEEFHTFLSEALG